MTSPFDTTHMKAAACGDVAASCPSMHLVIRHDTSDGKAIMKRNMFLLSALCVAIGMSHTTLAQDSEPGAGTSSEFHTVRRPGSVDLDKEYDLSNLQIPKEQIHTLLPRDAIPALTDPAVESVREATWLTDDARIIAVVRGDEVIGVPLPILDWHEVVNLTIGGEPIAVTYCPLCDSATVFSRKVRSAAADEPVVLEFGVSGALYNSNVLMYDRRDKGLWSQLGMKAVSGPLSGTTLEMLPVQIIPLALLRSDHPDAMIVSRDTGHRRNYGRSPYGSYFSEEGLMVPVASHGTVLPRKMLGLGVSLGDEAWFIPIVAIKDEFVLTTPAGAVRVVQSKAGVSVVEAPAAVKTAQSFYYAWSAFFPHTKILREGKSPDASARIPGLPVGAKAPDASLVNVEGNIVKLADLYKDGPVVLTFYRGGWCPFCSGALTQWQERLEDVRRVGGTFIALTPEKPTEVEKTIDKGGLTYTVLSDTRHEAAKAFKVHFVVDDQTRERYLEMGLNVGEANSSGTWELPAPATFVIDREGVIRYAFADWDYRKRADPDEVIRLLESLLSRQ